VSFREQGVIFVHLFYYARFITSSLLVQRVCSLCWTVAVSRRCQAQSGTDMLLIIASTIVTSLNGVNIYDID